MREEGIVSVRDRRLTVTILAALLLFVATVARGNIVYVECSDNLGLASAMAGPDDTLLVAPCTHELDLPIYLDEYGPAIISEAGAEATIIDGCGGNCIFWFEGPEWSDCMIHVEGFTIRNAQQFLYVPQYMESKHVTFTDNIVEDIGSDLNFDWGGGLIARNVFRENGGCLYIGHFYGTVESNEICYNDCGYYVVQWCGNQPLLRWNHIHHNSCGGVDGDEMNLQENIIEHNAGIGVNLGSFTQTGPNIEGNVIRGNTVGVCFTHYPRVLHGNDIYANTEYDAVVTEWYVFSEVDATMNWWGTTDPAEIAEHIWDAADDPTLPACVIYDPWCTSPGCGATATERTTWGAVKAMFR